MIYQDTNYLQHHGILGQKWGVRRYQNEDGTLTEAGKKRKNTYRTAEAYDKVNKYRDLKEQKAPMKERKEALKDARKQIRQDRGVIGKVATFMVNGGFGSMTYNRMRARGHGKVASWGSAWVANALGGPVGNVIVSAVINHSDEGETHLMIYQDTNYLQHHGILGQKWGVRRYQNEDGSLTSEGRKRYGADNVEGAHLNIVRKSNKITKISLGTYAASSAISLGSAIIGTTLAGPVGAIALSSVSVSSSVAASIAGKVGMASAIVSGYHSGKAYESSDAKSKGQTPWKYHKENVLRGGKK